MMTLTHRRADGSFLAVVNGYPYHIEANDAVWWEAAQLAAANLGEDLPLEVVPQRPPPELADYRRAIQTHVDLTAQQRGYDTAASCASYVASTNTVWAGEAAAFVAWRDAVWAHAYGELAKVEAGQRSQPGVEAFLAELPAFAWPA